MTSLYQILLNHNLPAEQVKSILEDYSKSLLGDAQRSPLTAAPTPDTSGTAFGKAEKSTLFEVRGLGVQNIKKDAPNIMRGDVVHNGEDWRNRDKYLWDGSGLVDLDTTYNDEGDLPSQFTLNEFPDKDYFSDSIDNHYVNWLKFSLSDIIEFKKDPEQEYITVNAKMNDGTTKIYKLFLPHELNGVKSRKRLFSLIDVFNDNGAIPVFDVGNLLELPSPNTQDDLSTKPTKSTLYEVSDITKIAIKKAAPNIQRGDVVRLKSVDEYRNMGKYIWDGKKIVSLYDKIDDYLSLPPEFTLNEFPDTHYFDESIEHNNIRWIRFEEFEFKRGSHVIIEITNKGTKYQYKINIKGDKAKNAEEWYDSLQFVDGALAIESQDGGEIFYIV